MPSGPAILDGLENSSFILNVQVPSYDMLPDISVQIYSWVYITVGLK